MCRDKKKILRDLASLGSNVSNSVARKSGWLQMRFLKVNIYVPIFQGMILDFTVVRNWLLLT